MNYEQNILGYIEVQEAGTWYWNASRRWKLSIVFIFYGIMNAIKKNVWLRNMALPKDNFRLICN